MLGMEEVINIDVIEMFNDTSCSTMSDWGDVLRVEGYCVSQRIGVWYTMKSY